ncbi:MAG TPA: hypothetical protein PLR25_29635 [Planctomycetaceae bacterium]|nr:hypothetical protein [Planctomycetaceae bacterium]
MDSFEFRLAFPSETYSHHAAGENDRFSLPLVANLLSNGKELKDTQTTSLAAALAFVAASDTIEFRKFVEDCDVRFV